LGGLVIMTAGSATTGTIRVDGGLAGAGGAYGGVGGTGGDALAVLIYGSSLTLAYGSVITAYGGAGSVGGVGNGAAGGKGGNGGNGGDLLLVTDSSVASSALSVLGGAGGAGGAGTPAGAAGLPGLDGLITIGGTFSDIGLASNTVVASTNQAGNFAVSLDVPDNKIKKDDKKGAAASK
jgi:hypothetical protein